MGDERGGFVWYTVWVENLDIWGGERSIMSKWLRNHRPPVQLTSDVWKATTAIRVWNGTKRNGELNLVLKSDVKCWEYF